MASASPSMPSRASSSTQTRSASCAPLHAVDTIARSSRRFGGKIPGVSTRMICAFFSITMPRVRARVVCTLRETIGTLEPTPAFTRDHHGGRILFGGALAATDPFGRRQPRQIDSNTELRVVMRPRAFDLPINRCWQSLALRPLLQHRLGVAQRRPRSAHALGPVALDKFCSRSVAPVEKYRPDHRFADVAEHGFAQASARYRPNCAKLDVVEQPKHRRHVSAALLAHEIGEPL